jgi:gas vesicle protein
MNTRKALTIAMVVFAGATAGLLLAPPKSRPAQSVRAIKVKESEDPFADMIEEGDGLLAQWKAEAVEAARKRTVA